MTQPAPPPRPPTNNLGLAAFITSLVSIAFAGILSPIALLLGSIALFKRPRGFAFAGFLIGLVGTVFLALWLAFFGFVTVSCINFGRPMVQTATALKQARQKVEIYQANHMGVTPGDLEGNQIISEFRDGWGHPLQYHSVGFGFQIRSAGPDATFGTSDDLSQ